MKRSAIASASLALILVFALGAQTKRPPQASDYGQWESLAWTASPGGFSPDGRWLVYGINRSNRDNELRVVKIADGALKTVAFGAQPAFSGDSKWLACSAGMSEADQKRLRDEKKPVQNKLALIDLAKGETATIEGVESFAFSPDGASLAMKRYAPAGASSGPPPGASPGPGRPGSGDEASPAPGATLVVRRLPTGVDTAFGNVAEYAWQAGDKGRYLAMVLSVEGKAGNGVQLYDPATGALRVLDSSSSTYSGLAWRKDAPDLAVFRAKTDAKKEGPTQVLLAWTGIGAKEKAVVYDPTADAAFPAGRRVVDSRRPAWSDTGGVIFLGIAGWEDKPAPAEDRKPGGPPRSGSADVSTVEIWHSKDVFVMPLQKNQAETFRRRSLLAAYHLGPGKLVALGRDPVDESVTPIPGGKTAYAAEWSKYAFNRTIGRPDADLYLVDVLTADRRKVREAVDDSLVQASPEGKYLLFIQDDHYWTVDTATGKVVNITASAPTSFIDLESDQTSPDKPAFGAAGWVKGDGAVLLYDKYDIWRVASDGSGAVKLTGGAAEEVRHRLVRLDAAGGGRRGFGRPAEPAEGIDLSKPLYLSLYGEWTKRSGYARLLPGGGVERLIFADRGVGGLGKAKNAEVYAYTVQDYDVSPDIFVAGPGLKDPKRLTATNAFQKDFAWGKSELLEYTTDKGRRLQGVLISPAGYEPGKTYPMIVYTYELLSQGLHNYVVPSERSYYNLAVFSANGYFVLQPDIVFRERQPGWSVVECVLAGVKKALENKAIDPKRVGIVGHSMGGFNSAFVATRVDGVFAAAVAGAPIIDMVSYYGDHHWGEGIAETDHIETGQERMVVPLYEDLQAYIDNSPYFGTHRMTVPLLLECGDKDGIVAWFQSIELYNVARRAGKNVVMLAYMGEDHGLRQEPNQVDYQRRILAWFGHYLKGEPAEAWITEGQSHLERQAEIKREKAGK
ncbi:MAG TPA: prolyl oligopeptidase family serine peptidase [Candidatus Aminicenantes bacterium]|nr:prolyl oligopeptidase family serine peptidase [Candidatus Aminicenantes bacterium]